MLSKDKAQIRKFRLIDKLISPLSATTRSYLEDDVQSENLDVLLLFDFCFDLVLLSAILLLLSAV